tara:strand:+ start:178 stop:1821 length:1644 start_codon:yes stop_codon:yes gene_type:complete
MNVGILLNDSNNCSYETYEICKKCVENENLEKFYVFELVGEKLKKKDRLLLYFQKGIPWLIRSICFSSISLIEEIIAKRFSKYNHFLEKYDLRVLNTKKIYFVKLDILFSPSGHLTWITNENVHLLKNLNIEFLINSGGGIWKGDILNCADKGIISFHHADNYVNRGGPPGFWEVFYKSDLTGFIIQRLNENLDNGEVISRGYTTTQRFWKNNNLVNRNSALREAKRIFEKILNGQEIEIQKRKFGIYSRRLYQTPLLNEIFIYVLSRLVFLITKFFMLSIKKKPIWETSFLLTNNWKNFELRKGISIPSDKKRFQADPNLVKINKKYFIFVEDCNINSEKAEIKCYEILKDKKSFKEIGSAINEKYHISFPFTFKFKNRLYMSVESSSNKTINIYRNEGMPLNWEIVSQDKFDSKIPVDPIIFYLNNNWWLIFGDDLSQNEMYIYFSNDPIDGEWKPHKSNPVYITSEYCRNAGLIIDQGNYYRIAQQSGFNNYGKSMKIMRIKEITEDFFLEEEVEYILPHFDRKIKGVHTLTKCDDLLAFDYWY